MSQWYAGAASPTLRLRRAGTGATTLISPARVRTMAGCAAHLPAKQRPSASPHHSRTGLTLLPPDMEQLHLHLPVCVSVCLCVTVFVRCMAGVLLLWQELTAMPCFVASRCAVPVLLPEAPLGTAPAGGGSACVWRWRCDCDRTRRVDLHGTQGRATGVQRPYVRQPTTCGGTRTARGDGGRLQ